jgi:hypothetical protein
MSHTVLANSMILHSTDTTAITFFTTTHILSLVLNLAISHVQLYHKPVFFAFPYYIYMLTTSFGMEMLQGRREEVHNRLIKSLQT